MAGYSSQVGFWGSAFHPGRFLVPAPFIQNFYDPYSCILAAELRAIALFYAVDFLPGGNLLG
ncbi:hypothetical protein D3C80_2226720 [compost metagenome]